MASLKTRMLTTTVDHMHFITHRMKQKSHPAGFQATCTFPAGLFWHLTANSLMASVLTLWQLFGNFHVIGAAAHGSYSWPDPLA